MRTASLRKLTVGAVAAGLVLTGCGTTAEGGSASDSGGRRPDQRPAVHGPELPRQRLRHHRPRGRRRCMEDEELADGIEVFNLEGAGGTVGLQRLVNEEGNAEMLMQMGLGVVGAQLQQPVRGHPRPRPPRSPS